MLTADTLHITILSTLDLLAMITNVIYIFIILRKTPKTMYSYSIILFNIACVDFLAAFCSFMCIAKLQNFEGRIVLIFIGPCSLINAQWCHLFLVGNANFVSHSVILLFLSFAYRLWITKSGSYHTQSRIWTASLIFVFSFILFNTALMYLGGSYEVPGFPKDLIISVIYLIGGSTENYLERFSVFALIVTNSIGFIFVFSFRRRLFESINRLTAESDRYNHRSLTAQMLLPIAYVFASVVWFLDFFVVLHSNVAERPIFILCSIFALASPMINMHYIPPYRNYLKSMFIQATIAPIDMSFTY